MTYPSPRTSALTRSDLDTVMRVLLGTSSDRTASDLVTIAELRLRARQCGRCYGAAMYRSDYEQGLEYLRALGKHSENPVTSLRRIFAAEDAMRAEAGLPVVPVDGTPADAHTGDGFQAAIRQFKARRPSPLPIPLAEAV